jgi:paraquat-inducible protein A
MKSSVKEKNSIRMVCHECDALQDVSHIPVGSTALCVCCGERLFKNTKSAIERPLALIIACAILFVVANSFPILQLTITGIERQTTLTGAALIFFMQGSMLLALTVWLTSFILPGFVIFALLYTLLSLYFNFNWPYTQVLLALVSQVLPWGMMDVFLLAILVALVKLASMTDVLLGVGFSAFVALIFCYAAVISSIEMHMLWDKLDTRPQGDLVE